MTVEAGWSDGATAKNVAAKPPELQGAGRPLPGPSRQQGPAHTL